MSVPVFCFFLGGEGFLGSDAHRRACAGDVRRVSEPSIAVSFGFFRVVEYIQLRSTQTPEMTCRTQSRAFIAVT